MTVSPLTHEWTCTNYSNTWLAVRIGVYTIFGLVYLTSDTSFIFFPLLPLFWGFLKFGFATDSHDINVASIRRAASAYTRRPNANGADRERLGSKLGFDFLGRCGVFFRFDFFFRFLRLETSAHLSFWPLVGSALRVQCTRWPKGFSDSLKFSDGVWHTAHRPAAAYRALARGEVCTDLSSRSKRKERE